MADEELCTEERVFDEVVCCDLPQHPFDLEHPCKATVTDHNGVVWHLCWTMPRVEG